MLFTAMFFNAATTVRAVVESKPINHRDKKRKSFKSNVLTNSITLIYIKLEFHICIEILIILYHHINKYVPEVGSSKKITLGCGASKMKLNKRE